MQELLDIYSLAFTTLSGFTILPIAGAVSVLFFSALEGSIPPYIYYKKYFLWLCAALGVALWPVSLLTITLLLFGSVIFSAFSMSHINWIKTDE